MQGRKKNGAVYENRKAGRMIVIVSDNPYLLEHMKMMLNNKTRIDILQFTDWIAARDAKAVCVSTGGLMKKIKGFPFTLLFNKSMERHSLKASINDIADGLLKVKEEALALRQQMNEVT